MTEILSPYEQIGGEPAVRKLCHAFYQIMADTSETKIIRDLHPENLSLSEDKLFMFLSGWLGGPQLYIEQYGHPRLRARHLPFSIGISERGQWLYCMEKALNTLELEPLFQQQLMASFTKTADFMRNRDEQNP